MKVLGFEFESEEEYKQAQKELQAIQYVKKQTKMNDPDVVLKVYSALVEQKAFETPVGYTFLEELQEYLKTVPYIKNEMILPITVKAKTASLKEEKHKKESKEPKKQKKSVQSNEPKQYKVLFKVTLFFAVVFLFIIGGMFTITYLSGDNINIINYENKIIDKYEKWEEELKERQLELDERESKWNEGHKDE